MARRTRVAIASGSELFPLGGRRVVAQTSREFESSRDPIRVELDTAHTDGYAAVVSLCGEHDVATSGAIRVALAPIDGDVLVDLAECEFIDSSVIGALLEKYEDLRRVGHRLELLVPPGRTNVRRIVDVTGLDALIAVHESLPPRSRV